MGAHLTKTGPNFWRDNRRVRSSSFVPQRTSKVAFQARLNATSKIWDALNEIFSTFNESFNFQERSQGPIPVDTVLILDPQTGMIERSWGRNLFYMPHGITICTHTGDVWLTDVAMHQVFKVSWSFPNNAIFDLKIKKIKLESTNLI